MYCEAEAASVTEPTPKIMPGSSAIAYLIKSVKISNAKSPRLVNSIKRAPPS